MVTYSDLRDHHRYSLMHKGEIKLPNYPKMIQICHIPILIQVSYIEFLTEIFKNLNEDSQMSSTFGQFEPFSSH